MNTGVHVSLQVSVSFPLGIYPGVELLDHMVVLLLVFRGVSILFSIVAAPVYIPANSVPRFPFLHFANTCYLLSLITAVLIGVRYLIMVLNCIFLRLVMMNIFSCGFWLSLCLPWDDVFSDLPCGSAGKESACNAGDLGSIPGLGRSPGEGKGYPLQYSGLESRTRLSNFHTHGCF